MSPNKLWGLVFMNYNKNRKRTLEKTRIKTYENIIEQEARTTVFHWVFKVKTWARSILPRGVYSSNYFFCIILILIVSILQSENILVCF